MEDGKESKTKKDILGTGALKGEWPCDSHRKTGCLATEIPTSAKPVPLEPLLGAVSIWTLSASFLLYHT